MTQPGDSAQSGADDAQSGAEDQSGADDRQKGSNGTEDAQSGDEGTEQEDKSKDADDKVSRAEFETLRKQLQAADQRRAKAEGDLRQLTDKDLPEIDKLKRDRDEAQQKVTELTSKLEGERITNAFLGSNQVDWHNPTRALALLDRSKITISSEGEVTGMKDAIAALSKSDPYLVKPKSGADAGKDSLPGTAPGNNGGNGSGKTGAAAMVSRIPALRGRVT